jgi:hypothetical protein
MSMDWVDRCMTCMYTLWDTDTTIISRMFGSVAHIGHQVVQDDTMVCDIMHTWAYNSGQWSFGAFPPGRLLDIGLEHTLDLRLPRIGEWMDEPRGATYTSMIELH